MSSVPKWKSGDRVRLSRKAGGFLVDRVAEVVEPGLERDGEPFVHVRFDPSPETRWLGREFEVHADYLHRTT